MEMSELVDLLGEGIIAINSRKEFLKPTGMGRSLVYVSNEIWERVISFIDASTPTGTSEESWKGMYGNNMGWFSFSAINFYVRRAEEIEFAGNVLMLSEYGEILYKA